METDHLPSIIELNECSYSALKKLWERLQNTPVKRRTSAVSLRHQIAWHLQAHSRGIDREAFLDDVLEQLSHCNTQGHQLSTGTRLVREWHGESHHVEVLPDGFDYRDCRYNSLSEIARTITGARWSGPRFFGLKSPSHDK
ncbi:MAG: DUF2924 domain-containing protein [Pseudomonadales bacterium]|nr:DUF2924 domain-containing protein [Pseudomonadales bacterium]